MLLINVLVVDDSAFMRKLISDYLRSESSIEVIGTARNGEDAIKKIKRLRPDVVTMDIEMPVMNGLEALKVIMDEHPVPVVMLSSTTKEGADETVKAMSIGAVDFLAKPSGTISLDLYKVQSDIVSKVIEASKVNIGKLVPEKSRISPVEGPKLKGLSAKNALIAIGTSTGGPRALQKVLGELPRAIPAPIVIVQHMPPGFTKSLATRLDGLSDITIKEAEQGEKLKKGTAYIAPGGQHLKIVSKGDDLFAHLDGGEPVNGHRPSVDVLFGSIADLGHQNTIAVIMTGMGSDGTKGLASLKRMGRARVIAEAEETCIVYGMPKAAVAGGYVDQSVELGEISHSILNYLR
ncbi:chemotaxis response regulator protein-glutamate methylesterase [Rossellomorea marisflavi]|uniref:Protein-glutamate methylesterase/protein-glutamine glutaminase n=1 Tax=Rossellomorea marisflavi TaxID=189381 RepID=A0A5D4RR94_9BACI|nr:chemotaxis response regulator protein-glutamate methylesterase [Rossellomorea marisflavi]TYS53863.1 chemotaxis response regulator protein-glutamate methylesterase [Rossellomorea marisflavi]